MKWLFVRGPQRAVNPGAGHHPPSAPPPNTGLSLQDQDAVGILDKETTASSLLASLDLNRAEPSPSQHSSDSGGLAVREPEPGADCCCLLLAMVQTSDSFSVEVLISIYGHCCFVFVVLTAVA